MIEPVKIGNCTLYLGDCREILPTIEPVDAVVTDPPYGVGLTQKTNDFRDSKYFDDGESVRASTIYQDDELHVGALIENIMPVILAKAARAALFTGGRLLHKYPPSDSVGGCFVPNGAGRDRWGFGCFQPILYYGKDPYLADGKGSRPNSFKDNQPNGDKVDHPCPKPLAWMKWLVNRVSRTDELVCDPFMGSGTTGMACADLGRSFIGIEIEPKYFDIACKRIEAAYAQGRLFA